jgi:hypothetical protein
MRSLSFRFLLTWFSLACLGACGGGGSPPVAGPLLPVAFSAASFPGGPVDNPYFPLPVGTTWVYQGTTEDGDVELVVEVTGDTKTILGVACVVVRAIESIDGEVVEDTLDWFAQDAQGNVWYLGEDSKDIEGGVVVGTEGSWEAGVAGAQAGIIMPAVLTPGLTYHQEFAPGIAEDMARILGVGAMETVPHGTFADCLDTEEFTPLEPGLVSGKIYAPGVGMIRDVNEDGDFIELVSVAP